MSVAVPMHLRGAVSAMAADFAYATGRWVEQGWHSADEVAQWRVTIRADMASDASVNVAIDGRGREERIKAWCHTWRKAALQERTKE